MTYFRIFFLSLSILLKISLLSQNFIQGKVIDKITKSPLPFTSLYFQSNLVGSTSNQLGEFHIRLNKYNKEDTLEIHYIGYKPVKISVNGMLNFLTIELEPQDYQLSEVVIRDKEPTYYIQKAIHKLKDNYPQIPFQTMGYYRELAKENHQFLLMNEAYFKTYYKSYQNKLEPNQHQLLLHRSANKLSDLSFMKYKIDKENKKAKKKAQRKGEEYESITDKEVVMKAFRGPERIMKMDLFRYRDKSMDSILFNKFDYHYGNDIAYRGKELMTIYFESKRAVHYLRQKGVIYMDKNSYAIVGIEYGGEIVVPLKYKPMMLLMGLSMKNSYFNKKMRYREFQNLWYPEYYEWDIEMELKKSHLFSKNEKSFFELEQIFKIDDLKTENIAEIPKAKIFEYSNEMESQIHNDMGLKWEQINTVPLETILYDQDDEDSVNN